MTLSLQQLHQSLANSPPAKRYIVALSGGLDSVVLLHALVKLRDENLLVQQLCALHVNHGLQPAAADFESDCARLCRELDVEYHCEHVTVASSGSQEDAARSSRYGVFQRYAGADDVVLLAHHLDDQLETLMQRLMRGAGPAGLAAMPAQRAIGKGQLFRPLLHVSRHSLWSYASEQKLSWSEDPSNADSMHDRNFLRNQVLPLLESRWPGYRESWSKSLGLLGEAATMLEEIAAEQLETVRIAPARLNARKLVQLSVAQQRNLLRHWLQSLGLPDPGWNTLKQLVEQVLSQREGSGQLPMDGYQLQVFDGQLYAIRLLPPLVDSPLKLSLVSGHTDLELPDNGSLKIEPAQGSGLSEQFRELEIRYRQGGESIQLPGRPNKSLKKLFQESAMPPWLRERVPLLFSKQELVCVPGFGIAESAQAPAGASGVQVNWSAPQCEISVSDTSR